MNIKNRMGVTITVLVITIIVMLILFGITFTTSADLLRNSQKNKMKTMLYMVQSRGRILLEDYLFDNEGVDVASKPRAQQETIIEGALKGNWVENVNEIKGVGYETSSVTMPPISEKIYCSWNEATLLAQGIDTKNLAKGDTIIVQYDMVTKDVDVATTKGFSKDGTPLHSLRDF